jgi:hypothetical protein
LAWVLLLFCRPLSRGRVWWAPNSVDPGKFRDEIKHGTWFRHPLLLKNVVKSARAVSMNHVRQKETVRHRALWDFAIGVSW